MAGVVVLLGIDLGGSGVALAGGLMVLLAGLGYAVGGIEFKRRMAGVDPAAIAAATMGVSAVLMLPAALLTLPTSAAPDSVSALLALGLLGTALAFLIFYGLIASVGPARASLVAYLAPGFAVVYGVAVLDEPVTPATFVGLGLILGGSYLAAGGRLPARRRAAVAAASRSGPCRSSSRGPARAP